VLSLWLFCVVSQHRGHREHREEALAMKRKCPICKAETDSTVHADFPFCSERCRDRDLGNWATEKYVVCEPAFTEEDAGEGEANAIVLPLDEDLDRSNDSDH
jgi:endogenous inhibitor of DNA gyrase (YacG/DUF329 family)